METGSDNLLPVRVRIDAPGASTELGRQLARRLASVKQNLLFLCIGTDRSTGDALGPFVGGLLYEARIPGISVRGTLEVPVHAGNLGEVLGEIDGLRPKPFIVAIDACLGRSDHVGTITLDRGPLQPGAGVNKVLPPVGDMHITGTVNIGGFMEYFVLQNTRLSVVVRMAKVIAEGIVFAVEERVGGRALWLGSGPLNLHF